MKSIGSDAFQNCTSLKHLELFCTITAFGAWTITISNIENVIVPIDHFNDYFNDYTSSNNLYPSSDICFKKAPTLQEFKSAMSAVNKNEVASIIFACDNVDDYLDIENIKSGLNPNCIIYAKKGSGITGDNVVEIEPRKSLSCDKLVLTDGYDFRAPQLKVGEVQYIHNPNVWANGKSGWESICLPFSPTTVKASTSGFISPIVLNGRGNYWLRKFVGSSNSSVYFSSTYDGVMEANTPYLIAFPGKAFDNNSLEGQTITFSANDAEVYAPLDPAPIKKNNFLFKSTYNTTADAQAGYALNAEGSSFVQTAQVGTSPFRAYFVNEGAANEVKALKIDFGTFNEETGIFELEDAPEMRMNENACYDLSGRCVSKNSTHKGIYIVNGKKVVR